MKLEIHKGHIPNPDYCRFYMIAHMLSVCVVHLSLVFVFVLALLMIVYEKKITDLHGINVIIDIIDGLWTTGTAIK
mgnify:CR=1 FL=1